MDRDQKRFLADKLAAFSKTDPRWPKLNQKLLRMGGRAIVPQHDPHLDDVLGTRAKLFPTKGYKFSGGQPSKCHWNVATLYVRNEVDHVVTGWALSDDSLWRSHTWGLQKKRVVETTERRKKYFGVVLNSYEASLLVVNLFFDEVWDNPVRLPGKLTRAQLLELRHQAFLRMLVEMQAYVRAAQAVT